MVTDWCDRDIGRSGHRDIESISKSDSGVLREFDDKAREFLVSEQTEVGSVALFCYFGGQMSTTTLFRPVGLRELALVWESGMREFPPRLPHQPIFYPVVNLEYALQIARDWNTKDEASGFAGFVTRFEVQDSFISDFEPHVVGSAKHVEYWIPADKLPLFNKAIEGLIGIGSSF